MESHLTGWLPGPCERFGGLDAPDHRRRLKSSVHPSGWQRSRTASRGGVLLMITPLTRHARTPALAMIRPRLSGFMNVGSGREPVSAE